MNSKASPSPIQVDLFESLPDHLIGYILTYFKVCEFIKIYDIVQGRTSQSSPISRSNMIFSESNQLAIKSLDLRNFQSSAIVQFIQPFINITEFITNHHNPKVTEYFSTYHQLKRLLFHPNHAFYPANYSLTAKEIQDVCQFGQ